jgi:hypothetical protein
VFPACGPSSHTEPVPDGRFSYPIKIISYNSPSAYDTVCVSRVVVNVDSVEDVELDEVELDEVELDEVELDEVELDV